MTNKTYNLSISEKEKLALYTSDQDEIRELFDNFKYKKKNRKILYALATNVNIPIDIIEFFANSEYNLASKLLSYNTSVPANIQIHIFKRYPDDIIFVRKYIPKTILKKETCEFLIEEIHKNRRSNKSRYHDHYRSVQMFGDIDEEFVLSKIQDINFYNYIYNVGLSIETKKKIIDKIDCSQINCIFDVYRFPMNADIIINSKYYHDKYVKNKYIPEEIFYYILENKDIGKIMREFLTIILSMIKGLEIFM